MRRRIAVLLILVGALAIAWLLRFGCDDAYISFHYARNLVRGDGLTWFGDHVEGYTNFAWVLWISGGLALGIDPLVWAWVGSLSCLAVAIVFTYRIALLHASPVAGACAAGVLATNFTFLAFGTSGLETMLQCALLTIATFEVERLRVAEEVRRVTLVRLSLVAALALWTRLDSAVPLAVLGVFALQRLIRMRAGVSSYVAAAAPAALLVGAWFAWKLVYYGELLPNTFNAKVAVSSATLAAAARFVFAFLHSYMLWPVLLIGGVVMVVRRRVIAPMQVTLVVAWLGYIVFVGGDFMEFRFFVPVMPAIAVLIAETVTVETKSPTLPKPALRASVLVAGLAAFSWRHAATFQDVADRYYDSVRDLATYYGMVRDDDWGKLGRSLGPALENTGATLACKGAGAIPYYSDIRTIDQLGLNDRWVALHGARPGASYKRPGHQRFATLEYLVQRKVTFVIGSPTVIAAGSLNHPQLPSELQRWVRSLLGATPLTVSSVLIVAAPLGDGGALVMWYLTPNPWITSQIRAAGWEIRLVVRQN